MPFPFEDLKVYQQSLNFVEEIETLCDHMKGKVSSHFLNQLSRASLSIPLNIAEGTGRWHKGNKKNFYWIARGSAFECVPILQILCRKKLIDNRALDQHYEQLEEITKMLSGLIKSVEELKR